MATDGIAQRLTAVRERIAVAARRAGRDPAEVRLLGVSKRMPVDRIVAAVEAGLTHLGENYVQEARGKLPEVAGALDQRGLPRPRWHFIGQLQRNKARDVVGAFDCIESLDRASLAEALDRRAAAQDQPLEVLIQVNLSDEKQKGGVAADDLPALLAVCAPSPTCTSSVS